MKRSRKAAQPERVDRRIFPVLPLPPGRVIFPRMRSPLIPTRQPGVSAVRHALLADDDLLLLNLKEIGEDSAISQNSFLGVGVVAAILESVDPNDGTVRIMVEGYLRVRVLRVIQAGDFFQAEAEFVDQELPVTDDIQTLMGQALSLFEDYAKANKKTPSEAIMLVSTEEDPGHLADAIAGHMNLKPERLHTILEAIDPKNRLEVLVEILGNELEMLEIESHLQGEVKKQMAKTQKEFYLQEQLKVIQRELGQSGQDVAELEELKEKIKAAGMTEEAEEKALKELSRLQQIPAMSAEAGVIRTYIDWLLVLPWSDEVDANTDIVEAESILEEDHYGLQKPKERILEYLAVLQLVEKLKGPILCFVGPPGVGKTSLGKSIARATKRKFVRMSLGGVRDEAEIRGHRRTYIGSLPGRIIQGLRDAKSRNPVFLLDEVDKMSMDFRGDPASALLEVLDPEQNDSFRDHYLDVEFDLSDIMFITTANLLQPVPAALRDRMEVIELPGYTEQEKQKIAELFLVPKQLAAHGLTDEHVTFSSGAALEIIQRYTREAGVRNLEREITNVCRKVARKVVKEGKGKSTRVTRTNLKTYLGQPRFNYGRASEKNEIGVATGLVYTQVGGDVISIETTCMPGEGKVILTGQLGDVMRESAQTALSYVRAHRKELHIPESFAFDKNDIHVHVPEGAQPKEGPSAGITLATAMASELARLPVRHDTAMTGEITLRGRVLPIGGLKEKVLAAHRAKISNIIIPAENKKDLDDIPEEIRQELRFHLVEQMSQVLERALESDDAS